MEGKHSITLDQAQQLAFRALNETGEPGQMVIDPNKIEEHDFGWLFTPRTPEFLETGDPKYNIPGVGRLVIDRYTGEATFLPTFMPPETALEQFIEKWEASQEQDQDPN